MKNNKVLFLSLSYNILTEGSRNCRANGFYKRLIARMLLVEPGLFLWAPIWHYKRWFNTCKPVYHNYWQYIWYVWNNWRAWTIHKCTWEVWYIISYQYDMYIYILRNNRIVMYMFNLQVVSPSAWWATREYEDMLSDSLQICWRSRIHHA